MKESTLKNNKYEYLINVDPNLANSKIKNMIFLRDFDRISAALTI